MKNIRSAVDAYNLFPNELNEVTDGLYQVNTGQHKYALKQSGISGEELSVWKDVYQLASKYDIRSILPVYLTKHSALYTKQIDLIHYLTPWITDEMNGDGPAIQAIFKCIAETHAKTKKVYRVEPAPIIDRFSEYRKSCSTIHHRLLEYVERFEQNRFMSPFELQVCTHFHVLNRTLSELDRNIEQFCNIMDDKGEWNYSLCHGNLDVSHVLKENQSYLINWENALFDNATVDLSRFFNHHVRHKYHSSDKLMEYLSTYISGNPLNQQEAYLLAITTLNPLPYIKVIDAYHDDPSKDTMVFRTQELEYAFRQLNFGLNCSIGLEKHIADKIQDDS